MDGEDDMRHYHRIRDLREDRDLTQDALCKELNMHKTTYTNYEQGKHSVPLDFAVILADYYNVSVDYIAGRTDCTRSVACSKLTPDEEMIIKMFLRLSERNKGRVEQFMEQLYDKQKEIKKE